MDFFEQQQQARKHTTVLLLLFALAILIIVTLVDLLVLAFADYFNLFVSPQNLQGDWQVDTLVITSLITLVAILSGSVRKSVQLRRGGSALAEMVGATEITDTAVATDEHQLMNVVEEMAVASGVPRPRVFVMRNESAINAFVAGLEHHQNVLVVTQGMLDHLDRDELQGVIGHEFSHLLNGDARLNLRMLSLLAGILVIGKIGLFLIHNSATTNSQRQSGSFWTGYNRRNDVSALFVFLIAGVALTIIGYLGLFLGRLIKATISRQRERLADASAIQFTRNPQGIGDALIKIRNGPGSLLDSVHAEDMNHMCFGDSVRIHWRKLLATHPEIDQRLAAINPGWVTRARVRERQEKDSENKPVVTSEHLGYAQTLLDSIPDNIRQLLRHPAGATLVVYALLLNDSKSEHLPTDLAVDTIHSLAKQIKPLGSRIRLPMIDLCLPALQQLSPEEQKQLLANISRQIRADGRVTLFEYLLYNLVRQRLVEIGTETVILTRFDQAANELQILLCSVIYISASDKTTHQALFSRYAQPLLPTGRQLLDGTRCSFKQLGPSLKKLRSLSPLLKKPLIDTLGDIVISDGKVQVEEAEILRLVCALLDCPMPPLTQQVVIEH